MLTWVRVVTSVRMGLRACEALPDGAGLGLGFEEGRSLYPEVEDDYGL